MHKKKKEHCLRFKKYLPIIFYFFIGKLQVHLVDLKPAILHIQSFCENFAEDAILPCLQSFRYGGLICILKKFI